MKTKWEMWITLRPRCGKYLSFIVNMLKPITISISVWHNGGSVRNKTFKKKGNVNIDKIKYPPPGDISLPYRKIRNHFKKDVNKKKKARKNSDGFQDEFGCMLYAHQCSWNLFLPRYKIWVIVLVSSQHKLVSFSLFQCVVKNNGLLNCLTGDLQEPRAATFNLKLPKNELRLTGATLFTSRPAVSGIVIQKCFIRHSGFNISG